MARLLKRLLPTAAQRPPGVRKRRQGPSWGSRPASDDSEGEEWLLPAAQPGSLEEAGLGRERRSKRQRQAQIAVSGQPEPRHEPGADAQEEQLKQAAGQHTSQRPEQQLGRETPGLIGPVPPSVSAPIPPHGSVHRGAQAPKKQAAAEHDKKTLQAQFELLGCVAGLPSLRLQALRRLASLGGGSVLQVLGSAPSCFLAAAVLP
jgi:hypothetical protein